MRPSGDSYLPYVPDYRLRDAYDEANQLDEAGLEALCPSYLELAENELRYRDDALLGQGSLKEVVKCWDSRSKRWVAMARLREGRGAEFYDHFVHEAWLTSSLSHPNIIKIYDVGVDASGRPFFTMDLKGETTLGDLVKNRGMQDRRELLGIFLRICDAIAYAHSHHVLHLDLKPDNIQAERFGEVLVCDWGLGKRWEEEDHSETGSPDGDRDGEPNSFDNMTLHGEIKGTLGYMAPEQVEPGARKDERTDIFSLGCMLHAILTGSAPFTGRTKEDLLAQTRRASFPPPRLRFPQRMIPESLEAVVLKAAARAPEDRYDSVVDLRDEIQKFLSGHATEAEEPGFLRAAGLFLARHRTVTAISLFALMVLGVFSFLFVRSLDRQQQATETERERASQLAFKADTLSVLYQSELNQSEQSRAQLALKLATSANSLKNLGIFESPAKTVREARELATMALTLDPDCEKGRIERFSLNCITLNFRDALTDPPRTDYKCADYLQFAEAFPRYDFTERNRPSPRQLATFYRRAREINPERGPLMERILSYDHAARSNPGSYDQVVIALLEYLNGGNDHLICSHNQEDSSFFLWSDRDVRLLIPEGSGSGRCLLRYLPFRSLELDIAGKFDLSELQLLPIETLDLRKSPNLSLRKPVSLPLLREIRIRPGQIEPGLLRQWIQSGKRLAIIETPERP